MLSPHFREEYLDEPPFDYLHRRRDGARRLALLRLQGASTTDLDVRDLREVIARATFEPFDWMGKLCLVAPRRSVQISTERMATEGAASEHDEPPPLEGG